MRKILNVLSTENMHLKTEKTIQVLATRSIYECVNISSDSAYEQTKPTVLTSGNQPYHSMCVKFKLHIESISLCNGLESKFRFVFQNKWQLHPSKCHHLSIHGYLDTFKTSVMGSSLDMFIIYNWFQSLHTDV